ncbi:TPA: MucBP domain-containing protein [Listeria monocytogenes]|nr:MucBP domain-containing protein [Listeria monocytogenes]
MGNNVWTSEELQINYDGTVGVDTYVWQPVRYEAKDLAVNYQDAEGNKIADSQIVSGNIGDSYDVSGEEYKLKIAGYTFQEVKGEVTGILTDKEQSVTYIYTKNPVKAKDLTVNYQDVEGNKVADSQIVSGNIGDSYDVSGEEYKLKIAGYTFQEVKGEVTGGLTDKEQTVTYIYTKNPVKAKDLTVNYQDAEGNKIADSQTVSGNIGDSYDVSGEEYRLEIAGYTFKEVKGEVTGILTDKEQSVTYVYTKNPVKAKDLTVNYQDAEGNKIADSQTVSGNIGDSYDVSGEKYKLEIAGYTFKEVKGEVTGILTDKEQSVTYVYTKDPVKAKDLTVNYQDTEGNKIADSQIVSGNIGDSYDVSGEEYKLEIAGYTFKEVKGEVTGILTDKEQSVTYVYTKNPVKAKDLTVNYQDVEGNKVADSQIVSGNIGDSYDVSGEEYKLEIAGYTFKEVKGEVTGGLTDKEQTVTYIYISETTKVKNKETSYSTEEKNEDLVQGSGNKYNSRKATLLPKTGEKQTFYLSLSGILLFFSGLIVMYWRFKIKE